MDENPYKAPAESRKNRDRRAVGWDLLDIATAVFPILAICLWIWLAWPYLGPRP